MKNIGYLFFLAITILCLSDLMGQTAGQYLARGDKELKDGYPQSALYFYEKALGMDSLSATANFKAGEACRIMRQYQNAAAYYKACSAEDVDDKYIDAIFWQAMMQKQMGDYASAKRSLTYFQSVYKKRDEFYRQARDEQDACDWAIIHMKDEPKLLTENLEFGLNSVHSEMSPLMFDSSTMYFASMRYEKEVVKKSSPVFIQMNEAKLTEIGWQIVALDLPINDENAHVGNGSFNADTSKFYYSKCITQGECEIFVSEKIAGLWSVPVKLGEPVNVSGSTNTQPHVAKLGDQEYLFFSSNRNTGKGGMDLWMVELKNGALTNKIRNLGTKINTKGDEITPWFDETDSTLYFSSNRQTGFGGFDIFGSKGKPGNFGDIENLGYGVNSPADDYYFSLRKSEGKGLYASNRPGGLSNGGSTCCNDIYRVKVPILKVDTVIAEDSVTPAVVVLDSIEDTTPEISEEPMTPKTFEELQDVLPISLFFHNDRPNPRSVAVTTNRTYVQTIMEFMSLEQEYLEAVRNSNQPENEKTEQLRITSTFFEDELKQSITNLDAALKVLLAELASGSSIQLVVKGYASPLANSDYNLNLTLRRIDAIENYLEIFDEGAFLKYLNTTDEGARLTIEKIPYGESQASQKVSDNVVDKFGAIYSPDAARERRIEILRVERNR